MLMSDPCAIDREGVDRGSVMLVYQTHEQAAESERRQAAAEYREPHAVPPGGVVVVHVEHADIEWAQPERYLLVVFDGAGAELKRVNPPLWENADIPRTPGGRWTSNFGAELDTTTFPVKVSVVERVSGVRCTWSVPAEGKPALVENGVVVEADGTVRRSDCDLGPVTSVSSGMTWVVLNDRRWDVEGRADWTVFQSELRACGLTESASALYAWRKKRRLVNTMAGLAVLTYGVTLIPAPIFAMDAKERRLDLEAKLKAGQ